MYLFVICVSFAVFMCGTTAHHHDTEMGVELGELVIEPDVRCPVWAVSYNALRLDCSIRIHDLDFSLDNTRLRAGQENGVLYLKLGQLSSIPERSGYKLMVNRNGQLVGSLAISPKMVPKPAVLPELSRLGYGVRSGNVTILNAKTIYLPDFSYDGRAPDAFFWVGKGKPNHEGMIIPDETGSKNILGAYNRKSVILKLPGSVTVENIEYLSVWCREYKHDFGHVMIPSNIMVPPATYMPLVADYSQMTIAPIDGSEILKFDAIHKKKSGSNTVYHSFSSYFILLPALLMLYK